MRRLIEIATERRVTIVMLMVAIVLFGMVSLSRLKLNLLPDISYPTVTIRTELTGAAPVEVENLLTKPIEEAVGVIRNVRLVRSVSRSGQSDVTLEFLWGTDMDIAGVDVREKLDLVRADLPDDVEDPRIQKFDVNATPIVTLALTGDLPVDELYELADDRLRDRLSVLRGVADVHLRAEQPQPLLPPRPIRSARACARARVRAPR